MASSAQGFGSDRAAFRISPPSQVSRSRRITSERSDDRVAPPFATTLFVVIGAALVFPYVAIMLSASATRTLFPFYVLVLGLFLKATHRPLYPAFCLAVFAFSPFLRRVADYHAGFLTFNPILLAPYVTPLPCILPLLKQVLRPERRWLFLTMLACFTYGCVLALAQNNVTQALFEPLRWVTPIALCAFIMERPDYAPAMRRSIVHALMIMVVVLTIYGISQYYNPPLWDTLWMVNVHNPTFGFPVAREIRVFSMLNSPASAALFVSAAMLILASEPGWAPLIAIAGLPLIGLTIIRSAWVELSVGLLVMLLMVPWRRKAWLIAFLVLATLAISTLLSSRDYLPNEIRYLISDRLDTLVNLRKDPSADERLSTYGQFYSRIADSPLGEGFGVNGSTMSDLAKQNRPALDSAIMESFLTFGVLGGIIYFLSLLGVLANGYRACRAGGGRLAGCVAAFCAMLACMPLGTTQIGEVGVVAWTGMGLLLADYDFRRRVRAMRRAALYKQESAAMAAKSAPAYARQGALVPAGDIRGGTTA